ncbi:type II toxin-antitoxin system RelE/ParE family toxin [Rhizobium oryzicola]|uniref:Toxin n=1 Tax=Rhizobium oryzicola TaxID=1232668 RepID=A0ABT8T1V8_9HYPH|nr:type II toxin-antitoxin system RelE/ParE family toxin [Rhizobium oryzicola]MDO1584652.1 type II toxin-antitoxin system RelE/ParE family toxin [Rhizobium oryzicola]
MGYRLTVAAEEDIIAIATNGFALFGESKARQYHQHLLRMFELISLNPRMARERDEITPPVRVHPFQAHLIIYRIEENNDILVIRVRHAHEDWIADSY